MRLWIILKYRTGSIKIRGYRGDISYSMMIKTLHPSSRSLRESQRKLYLQGALFAGARALERRPGFSGSFLKDARAGSRRNPILPVLMAPAVHLFSDVMQYNSYPLINIKPNQFQPGDSSFLAFGPLFTPHRPSFGRGKPDPQRGNTLSSGREGHIVGEEGKEWGQVFYYFLDLQCLENP